MRNAELKREADRLVGTFRLQELLATYEAWFLGGSYSYDLMCWRDLDIYVLDAQHVLRACFDVAFALTHRLGAWKARFTNNLEGTPHGYYWGIKLGDERAGAWKLDLWFLDAAGYEAQLGYTSTMRERLSQQTRASILAIKDAYWRRPEYRNAVTSDDIYRAVFEGGVRTLDEFEKRVGNGRGPS